MSVLSEIPICSAQSPDTKDQLEGWIVDGTVLIEDALGIFLLPSPIRLLAGHDQSARSFDNRLVGILTIDER